MMAMAAILTAWTGFQSAKWSGQQAKSFAGASALRTESIRFDNRASEARSVDVAVFVAWLEAVNDDVASGALEDVSEAAEPVPGTLSAFLHNRVRDEFRPAFLAWIDAYIADRATAPPTPFAMEEYVLADALEAERLATEAGQSYLDATEHNERSDRYVLTTVLFALVLFFCGVSTKLSVERNKRIAVGMALTLMILGLVAVALQPVHPLFG